MALGLALAAVFAGAEEPPAARAASLVGELVAVDLGRSSVTVRPEGREPREVELRIDAKSSLRSGGRALDLGQLRAGERVVVVFVEEAPGRRRITSLRMGPASAVAPEAGRRP